jgi:hypothetical protein
MSIVVLDEDFQVAWAWDSFDHLDVNRAPILGELYNPGDTDQVALSTPILPAVAWVHINAVSWSPADGNLIVSSRQQDWVIKIDYENGEGDGHVVWRLGQDGDFTVNSPDPNPWFSHQHNAHYIDDSTLILFDNGNTRQASDPDAHSRGQLWTLDEKNMTATLVFNVDLGNYSGALGAAQPLSNGNYSFTSGFQGEPPNLFGQSIEVRPDGTKAYVLEVNRALYRSFRVRTLYEGTNESRDSGEKVSQRGIPYRSGSRPSFGGIGAVLVPPLAAPPESLTFLIKVSPPIPTRAANAAETVARLDRFFSADTAEEPGRTFPRPKHESVFADLEDSLSVEWRVLALSTSDQ